MFQLLVFGIVLVVAYQACRRSRSWWRQHQVAQAERKARIRVTATLNRPRDFTPAEVAAAKAVVAGEQAFKAFERGPARRTAFDRETQLTWNLDGTRKSIEERTLAEVLTPQTGGPVLIAAKPQPHVIELIGPASGNRAGQIHR